MKTRNLIKQLFILTIAMFIITSCTKETVKQDVMATEKEAITDDAVEGWIEELTPPQAIDAGEPAAFGITFVKPDPCHALFGYSAEFYGEEVEVKVQLEASEDPCIQIIDMETGSMEITFPSAGDYLLRFNTLQGPDSLVVVVK